MPKRVGSCEVFKDSRAGHLVRALRAITRDKNATVAQRLKACELLMPIDPSIDESQLRVRLQMLRRAPLNPLTLALESSPGAQGTAGQTEVGTSKDLEALELNLCDRNDPRNEDADLETLLQRAPAGGDSKAVDGRA